MPAQEKPKAVYRGDGNEHLTGVPARDLSDDDYAALTEAQRAAVGAAVRGGGGPLYDVREDKPARKPADDTPATPARRDT